MTNNRTSQAASEIELALFGVLNCFPIDACEVSGGETYIDSEEAKLLARRAMARAGLTAVVEKYKRMEEALRRIADPHQYGSDDCDYQSWLGSDHRFVGDFAKEVISFDPLAEPPTP